MTFYALLAGVLDPVDEHHRHVRAKRERAEPTERESGSKRSEAILGSVHSSMGSACLRAAATRTIRLVSLRSSPRRTLTMTASLNADSSQSFKTPWYPKKMPYPPARRSDTVEYFQSAKAGKKVPVADPYDWLHDPDSKETKQFVQQQGDFTQQYLDQYKHKEQFTRELRKNWNYPRCAFPISL